MTEDDCEWGEYAECDSSPMTPAERQRAIDLIFSDAPDEMKKRLRVRPIVFVNQDGVRSSGLPASNGYDRIRELGRQAAMERERKVLDIIFCGKNE